MTEHGPTTVSRIFVLEELEGAQPSGNYSVETRGEHNRFLPFLNANHTSTWIRVCRKSGISGVRQIIDIDPLNLADDPKAPDRRRGRIARRKGYREIRQHRQHRLHALQADETILRRRQEELKFRLLGATSATWPDAVAMANYLIDIFAATPRTRTLRRGEFTVHTQDDLTRLGDQTKEQS